MAGSDAAAGAAADAGVSSMWPMGAYWSRRPEWLTVVDVKVDMAM